MICAGGAGIKGGELKNNKKAQKPARPIAKYRKGDSIGLAADHISTLN